MPSQRQIHLNSFISLLLLTSLLFNPSTAADTITPTQSLTEEQTLESADKVFELGFFSPDNSSSRYIGIWYKNIPGRTVVWVANREAPLHDSSGVLNLTSDGNLILFDHTGHVFWSTNTSSATEPFVQLSDLGNLVLTDNSNGAMLWQSFDHPSHVSLTGMRIGWDLRTNLNRRLTSWKSHSDPSPGPYSYELDPHGIPEGVIWNGSAMMYRTGPWNGQGFGGLPVNRYKNIFEAQLVCNQTDVYYTVEVVNKSISSFVILNPDGVVQRLVRQSDHEGWSVYWFFPFDTCDHYAHCGSFGACDRTISCDCLPGFKPRFEEAWALRDGSGGCVRRTALDCGKGNGFKKLSGVKLPDTSNSSYNAGMVFEDCQNWCLRNCSCLAFAMNGNIGCVIWVGDLINTVESMDGGEDLYIRLAASELDSTKNDSSKKKKIVGMLMLISVILVLAILALAALYLWKMKRKQGRTSILNHAEANGGKDTELPLIDLATISSATGNFSPVNKLGEGGFGPVYKGMLFEGQVAVKRLSRSSGQGLEEFKSEIQLVAKLQHTSLVRLLGYCIDVEEKILIYEYMPNGSLDKYLFDPTRGSLLDWGKRRHIIEGIIQGLLYLHKYSRLKIIHRDLKASNILLDSELNPKISDFGMARIFNLDMSQANTNRVVGTYGYMSPEYAMEGLFSVKSDVFSFGVLLLEILSGKKNTGRHNFGLSLNLIGYTWDLWTQGKEVELTDPTLGDTCPAHEIKRCINVALLCVQESAADRPTVSDVFSMLTNETTAIPNPKQPAFFFGRKERINDLQIDMPILCSANGVTVSAMEGR